MLRSTKLKTFILATFLSTSFIGGVQAELVIQNESEHGNAHLPSFDKALKGGGSLSEKEERALLHLIPERTDNRYYLRLAYFFHGRRVLDQMKNRSTGTLSASILNQKSFVSRLKEKGAQVAVGYGWAPWRAEGELFLTKKFTYNPGPLFVGVSNPATMSSSITNYTLLANAYYDFDGFGWLQPYVMGGAGFSLNSIQFILKNSSGDTIAQRPKPSRNLGPAFTAGVGLRVSLFSSGFIDFGYRAFFLGVPSWHVKNAPTSTDYFKVSAWQRIRGLNLGVIFLF